MEIHHFPTAFARNLAANVGLFHLDVHSLPHGDPRLEEADRFYGALRDFQKLALFNDLDGALIAYHGIELNGVQKDALKVIHESAKIWALGHVAEVVMNKLEDDPKQTAEMAKILIEQFNSKNGEASDRVKRFVVKLADLTVEEENK